MSVQEIKKQRQVTYKDKYKIEQGVFSVVLVFIAVEILDSEQNTHNNFKVKVACKCSEPYVRVSCGVNDYKLWYNIKTDCHSNIVGQTPNDVIENLTDLKQAMTEAQELIDEFFANDKSEGEE